MLSALWRMRYDVCSLSVVIWCLLYAVCSVMSDIWYMPCVVCTLPSALCCLLSVCFFDICGLLFAVNSMLSGYRMCVVWCQVWVVCSLIYVICCLRSALCCLLSDVWSPRSDIILLSHACCLMSAICSLLIALRRPLSDVCSVVCVLLSTMSSALCRQLSDARYLLFVWYLIYDRCCLCVLLLLFDVYVAVDVVCVDVVVVVVIVADLLMQTCCSWPVCNVMCMLLCW